MHVYAGDVYYRICFSARRSAEPPAARGTLYIICYTYASVRHTRFCYIRPSSETKPQTKTKRIEGKKILKKNTTFMTSGEFNAMCNVISPCNLATEKFDVCTRTYYVNV